MKCKICKSKKIKKLFQSFNQHGRHIVDKNDVFHIYQCLKCYSVFPQNIRIDKNYFKKYYELDYYNQPGAMHGGLLYKIIGLVTKFSNSRKERLIYQSLRPKKKVSILDIGSGKGNFLAALDHAKFNKFGVEINKVGFEASRKKRLQVFLGDVTKVNFGRQKFDVVSLWHVLEHIDNIHSLMKKIDSILAPNGILIFQIPNPGSLGFIFGRQHWFHLDTPRHLTLCSESGVRILCLQYNFRLISVINEFYEYPLDLFWSIRHSPIRWLFYPLYPLIKLFDRETLTFVCRKLKV